MKVKEILWTMFYTMLLCGGMLLCCFAEPLKNSLFNCIPMGVVMIILGFLGWVFDFIEYIVDKIIANKKD